MSTEYIEKSLKHDEEIISIAELNQIIIIPSILNCLFWTTIMFSTEFFEIKLLLIPINICLFIDIFKICICLNTTELCFTNKRMIGKVGWVNTKSLDAPLKKINDVSINQGFFGKIFGYSTLKISTSSSSYNYKYIKNAEVFKNVLTDFIDSLEQNSNQTVILNNDVNKADNFDKIRKLKQLLDDNIISQEEFEKEKSKLLQ